MRQMQGIMNDFSKDQKTQFGEIEKEVAVKFEKAKQNMNGSVKDLENYIKEVHNE